MTWNNFKMKIIFFHWYLINLCRFIVKYVENYLYHKSCFKTVLYPGILCNDVLFFFAGKDCRHQYRLPDRNVSSSFLQKWPRRRRKGNCFEYSFHSSRKSWEIQTDLAFSRSSFWTFFREWPIYIDQYMRCTTFLHHFIVPLMFH